MEKYDFGSGNREQIAQALCHSYGRLTAMAHRYYRDRDNVLDLVQDTICKVLSSESTASVRSVSELMALCSVAMRSIRYNDYHRECIVSFVGITGEDDLGASYDIVNAEAMKDIGTIRSTAKNDCRIDAALRMGEGYSEREIAELQGVPVSTIKNRIYAGRKIIRSL